MLCCDRMLGCHTAESLYIFYERTIETFALSDRVTAIVTDKAINMVKVFALPGTELPEEDNGLNAIPPSVKDIMIRPHTAACG